MNFDAICYIETLLDNFARNFSYYSYLKLKKCKSTDICFTPPYSKNLLSIKYINNKSKKKVSWNKNLLIVYNY